LTTHPKAIEQITPEWLTEVLRDADVLRQSAVVAVAVQAIGQGIGFLSNRARLTLTYDDSEEGAPDTVIVKLPATTKEGADFAESTHLYEREIRFYRDVAPYTAVHVPRLYASVMDPAEDIFILILEDLRAFTAGDQVAGVSRAQALACASAIAPLHATWWRGDQRQALPWVPTIERQLDDLAITATRFREAWPPFLAEYGELMSPAGRALGERVSERLEAVLAKFFAGTRTLVHFDYRADNLFFDELGHRSPVVVLDWQLVTWGPGAYDLARLVGGSLPADERGGHHEEIVERWHGGLLAGGVSGYGREEAWHDYRLSAIVAMLNPVLYNYLLKTGGPRGTELAAAMASRFFSDLVECDAEAVIP
jgi:aminoglycoside phosphotransferase (APT) family kinase protein